MKVFKKTNMSVNVNKGSTVGPTSTEGGDLGGSQGAFETAAVATDGRTNNFRPGGHAFAIQDILCRDHQVLGTTLATGNVPGSEVFDIDPLTLFLNLSSVSSTVNQYAGLKCNLVVTIATNLPAGCYGLYCVTALPNGRCGINTGQDELLDSTNVEATGRHGIHAMIDCAASNNVQLKLPYVWPEDWTNIRTYGYGVGEMWRVRMQAHQPLRNINADSYSAAVTVWVRLEPDYALVNPIFQSGKISSGMKVVATGLNIGSEMLDALGYTKDPDSNPPVLTTGRYFTNPSTVDGLDTSESVSLRSAPYVDQDPKVGGFDDDDPATFENLFKHWTLVGRFPWATTNLVGDVLATVPVTPGAFEQITTYTADKKYGVWLMPAGYVGLPFSFWRGGMEYEIAVPVSAFHRGMLQVIWSREPITTASVDATGRTLNVIMDISLGKTHTVGVDYAHHLPACDMVFTNYNSAADSTTAVYFGNSRDSIATNPSWCNGYLTIRVIQRLVASTTSGNAADTAVLVYARAKPDMRFGVPRTHLRLLRVGGTNKDVRAPLQSVIRYQSGVIGSYADKVVHTELVKTPGSPMDGPNYLWGDNVSSVRGLMQRMSPLGYARVFQAFTAATGAVSFNVPDGTGTDFHPMCMFQFSPLVPRNPDAGFIGQQMWFQNPTVVDRAAATVFQRTGIWNWYAHYAMLFTGVRSSLRIKVDRIWGSAGQAMATLYSGEAGQEVDTAFSTADDIHNLPYYVQSQPLSDHTGAEFVFPYSEQQYYRNPYIQRGLKDSLPDKASATCACVFTTGEGNTTNVSTLVAEDRIWYGAGPDVTPLVFRRVPYVVLQFASVP